MNFKVGDIVSRKSYNNDIYFKISREEHNLDRARTQFKLVADMESKWDQMHAIVKKYSE